jgi:hypothetical protein
MSVGTAPPHNTPPIGIIGRNTGQNTVAELLELVARLEKQDLTKEADKVRELSAKVPSDALIVSQSQTAPELFDYFFQTFFHSMKNIAGGVFGRMRSASRLIDETGDSISGENLVRLKEKIAEAKGFFDLLWDYIKCFAGHVSDMIPLKPASTEQPASQD